MPRTLDDEVLAIDIEAGDTIQPRDIGVSLSCKPNCGPIATSNRVWLSAVAAVRARAIPSSTVRLIMVSSPQNSIVLPTQTRPGYTLTLSSGSSRHRARPAANPSAAKPDHIMWTRLNDVTAHSSTPWS